MEVLMLRDDESLAYMVSIMDPFHATSYVAWLDRWNDNNGRDVSEDGSHSPCEM